MVQKMLVTLYFFIKHGHLVASMVECEEERSDCSVLIGRCCCCCCETVTRSPGLARMELGLRPGAGADDEALCGSSSTPDLK